MDLKFHRNFSDTQWKKHYADVPGIKDAVDQIRELKRCVARFEANKCAVEYDQEVNNETIRYHEEKIRARCTSRLSRAWYSVEKLLTTYEGRTKSEKIIDQLAGENRDGEKFIKEEERKLRDFKFYLYEHSNHPEVWFFVQREIDFFIRNNFTEGPQAADDDNVARYHDLLYLSRFGGGPVKGGSYRFNAGQHKNPFCEALPKEMRFLAELGMIEAHKSTTFENNLTRAGSAVLKRLDETLGPCAFSRYFPYRPQPEDKMTYDAQ
jgi:hypothetical protein